MPDGELAPNGGKRGLAVFQVPEVMSALRLNFDSNVFGTGTATVNLSQPSFSGATGPIGRQPGDEGEHEQRHGMSRSKRCESTLRRPMST